MALSNYSGNNIVLHINGRQYSAFGQTETPVVISQLNDKTSLHQGMNGEALKFTRVNEGYSLSVSLLPATKDSLALSTVCNNADADIYASYVTISTGEEFVLTEGVFISMGDVTRGGSSVSDDVYNFQFNLGEAHFGESTSN